MTYSALTNTIVVILFFGFALLGAFLIWRISKVETEKAIALRNKKSKQIAIVFGAFLFAIWLYPFQNHIEQLLYPRNDMNTYLQVERTPGKEGFMLTIFDKTRDLILRSYSEREEMGRDIYIALAKSRSLDQIPSVVDWKYRFDLFQDSDSDRFRELTFDITEDGRLILLKSENRQYYFEGTQEFQSLMADFNKEVQLK